MYVKYSNVKNEIIYGYEKIIYSLAELNPGLINLNKSLSTWAILDFFP